jgi:hypothetical protein
MRTKGRPQGLYAKNIEVVLRRTKAGGTVTPGLASTLTGLYCHIQDRDGAITWLRTTTDRLEGAPLLLKTPIFDFVRDDPRFRAIEARVFAQE